MHTVSVWPFDSPECSVEDNEYELREAAQSLSMRCVNRAKFLMAMGLVAAAEAGPDPAVPSAPAHSRPTASIRAFSTSICHSKQ